MDIKKYSAAGLQRMLTENPDLLFLDGVVKSITCPVCGCENVHMEAPIHKPEGEYKSWAGRGEAIEIPMWCEYSGHVWVVGFGFHKGNTGMFCEVIPSADGTPVVCTPDEIDSILVKRMVSVSGSGWVSVAEGGYPKENEHVLVYGTTDRFDSTKYVREGFCRADAEDEKGLVIRATWFQQDGSGINGLITHWHPFPSAPTL